MINRAWYQLPTRSMENFGTKWWAAGLSFLLPARKITSLGTSMVCCRERKRLFLLYMFLIDARRECLFSILLFFFVWYCWSLVKKRSCNWTRQCSCYMMQIMAWDLHRALPPSMLGRMFGMFLSKDQSCIEVATAGKNCTRVFRPVKRCRSYDERRKRFGYKFTTKVFISLQHHHIGWLSIHHLMISTVQ